MSHSKSANDLLQGQVMTCLQDVVDPCSAANGTNLSLSEMGMVKAVEIEDGDVHVDLRITSPACFMLEYFYAEIRKRVEPLEGVRSVVITADAGLEWEPSMMDQDRRREYLDALRRVLPERISN